MAASAGAIAGAAAGAAGAASAKALIYSFLVMTPQEFIKALDSVEENILVVKVMKDEGIIHKKKVCYYVASLRGLIAVTKSPQPLTLPSKVKVVTASKLILPTVVWNALSSVSEDTNASVR